MSTLLAKEHRITEKGMMEFQPFGVKPDGTKIRDFSGIVMSASVEYLEHSVSGAKGAEAGRRAVDELVRRLNERLPDPSYRVTAKLLRNSWNSYTMEFAAFVAQFCVDISEDQEFHFNMARRKVISPIIRTMGLPFSVSQIYKSSPYFVSLYYGTDIFCIDVVNLADASATLRMRFGESTLRQWGPYVRGCAVHWCAGTRGYWVGVPEVYRSLPPAIVTDRQCIVQGDEYCEWEVAWSAGARRWWPVINWGNRHRVGTETEQRQQIIEQQAKSLDEWFVELKSAYSQQQQLTAELQRRVDQLTTLHESGLIFASILDREALIEKVLDTVTEKLRYDRGMICLFDKDRKVSYRARIRGVPNDVAEFAHSLEIPVTDPDSLEGTVLLKGEPVLVDDIRKVYDRLHPLYQELVRKARVKSMISVPLTVKNQVLGSLTVDRARDEILTREDLNLVGTLASQVAIALDNTQAYRQIEELLAGLEAKVRERTAELAKANDKLKELDRLKSDFFANISHELRTPLTLSLSSYRALLRSASAKDKETEDFILSGMRNTSRLLYLINELLDLARFDSGRAELKKRCIDLSRLLRDVSANFSPSSKRRIHLHGLHRPVAIEADPDQLKKVVYNLLSNAFKFSDPDSGQVWVRLRRGTDIVELEVEDNGIGIPRDYLERIFDRFTQAETGATRKYEGTGIGLALVNEIVKLHGGKISVRSEVGQGSTFIITLPVGDARDRKIDPIADEEGQDILPPFETPSAIVPADSSQDQGRTRLLVVEDNADMRRYLERLLSSRYGVLLAKNGSEGLAKVKSGRPDLILTDASMPQMSGYELIKAIRTDQEIGSTPIIMLTARAGSDARIQSYEAGADDYVSKPFNESELLARINNILTLRRQERELASLREEKLKRFLPSQLANLISSGKAEAILKSHRREVTVVFLDIRGFTTFARTADPKQVMEVLHEYQTEMGRIIGRYGGTLERFTGDGMMIFFNDPIPVPDHAEKAARMAIEMQDKFAELRTGWEERGFKLGFGIGIATGSATLGMIGFEGRRDYAAIGTVTNMAARLCHEARHGQILISGRVRHLIKDVANLEKLERLKLKGFTRPVSAFNILGLKT